jgi:hypothetical protein
MKIKTLVKYQKHKKSKKSKKSFYVVLNVNKKQIKCKVQVKKI